MSRSCFKHTLTPSPPAPARRAQAGLPLGTRAQPACPGAPRAHASTSPAPQRLAAWLPGQPLAWRPGSPGLGLSSRGFLLRTFFTSAPPVVSPGTQEDTEEHSAVLLTSREPWRPLSSSKSPIFPAKITVFKQVVILSSSALHTFTTQAFTPSEDQAVTIQAPMGSTLSCEGWPGLSAEPRRRPVLPARIWGERRRGYCRHV